MNLEYITPSFFSRDRYRIGVAPDYIKMIEL
jgi:hypothetical protein